MTSTPARTRGVHSLKVGTIAQTLPLFAGYGVSLLTTPYVVARLGLIDFGIWSMTAAFAQPAVMFDLGITRANDRYVALFHAREDVDSERSASGVCMTVLVGLAGILFATALFIPGFVDQFLQTDNASLTRDLLLCAVTMIVCGMFARAFAGCAFGHGRQVWANAGLAVQGVGQAVGGVIGLITEPTLRGFAVGTAAGSCVGLGAVIAAILYDEHKIVVGRPRLALAREMIAYGLVGQVRGVADVVMIQAPKLIAGSLLGPAAAGVYELGSRLVQGAVTFGSAASGAVFVEFTRNFAVNGMDGILDRYAHLTRRNAAVTLFLPFLLCATSFSVVPLWLGKRHFAVVMILVVLAVAITVRLAANVCVTGFLAMGRPGVVGATAMGSAVMTVALAIPLTHAFGFKGLIAAFGCGIAIGNLLSVWYLQKRLGVSMTEFYGAVRGPFAVGLFATIAAMPIGIIASPHDRASALIPFVLSSAVFVMSYGLLGRYFDQLPSVRGGWR